MGLRFRSSMHVNSTTPSSDLKRVMSFPLWPNIEVRRLVAKAYNFSPFIVIQTSKKIWYLAETDRRATEVIHHVGLKFKNTWLRQQSKGKTHNLIPYKLPYLHKKIYIDSSHEVILDVQVNVLIFIFHQRWYCFKLPYHTSITTCYLNHNHHSTVKQDPLLWHRERENWQKIHHFPWAAILLRISNAVLNIPRVGWLHT